LHEDRRGIFADYSVNKKDVISYKILAPENSRYKDLSVWNVVENFEDKYGDSHYKTEETRANYKESAQTASTIVLALPNELSVEVCQELLEKFIDTRFTSRGLISTYAIHDKKGNLHAHIQTTRRAIGEDGEFLLRKDRAICARGAAIETRKLWADLANEYLEREGFKDRISEKSFADLGISLEPTKHRDWYGDMLGENSRIIQENQDVERENVQRILKDPNIIIDFLNSTKAVFTQKDILRELEKRLGNEGQISHVFEQILEEAKYVGESGKGEFLYTGEKYQKLEADTIAKFESLSLRTLSKSENISIPDKFSYLSTEQKEAVLGLTANDGLGILVGRAGAGKTSTMAAVAEIYKEKGSRVIGMSLSAVASENLGTDANIESRTIASWTYSWRCYETAKEKFLSFNEIKDKGLLKQIDWYQDLKRYEGSQLREGDVIVVDEAGMVGTESWNEILTAAEKFGAKVIAIGDDNQFEAISSGDCFRKFIGLQNEKGKVHSLNEIRRQETEWMKEASVEFSKLNVGAGLELYERHGNIHEFDTKSIVEKYLHNEQKGTTAILCYKRATCKKINDEIRNIKKERGELGNDILRVNSKDFAENDRIILLQNDGYLGIKNGMTGTVISGNSEAKLLSIKLEDGRAIQIDTEKYDKLDHGYAMTLHKSQGKTFDNVIIIAEKGMDAKATYVGMTRHRNNVDMYYSKDDFSSFKQLTESLSKYRPKDLIADYISHGETNKAKVYEYQNALMETASILKDINQGIGDWKDYREVKDQSLLLGKEILQNYENHKLYLDQLGITKERLEINLGLKQRPLSNVELNAKDTVALYAKTAEEARSLFRLMKKEGFNIAKHDRYDEYSRIREIRNDLAKEILSNYPLHREFVTTLSREYFISKKCMENQVNYGEAINIEKAQTKDREERLDRFYVSIDSEKQGPNSWKEQITYTEKPEITLNNDLNNEKELIQKYVEFSSKLEKAKTVPIQINYNWETVTDKINAYKNDPAYCEKPVNFAMVAAYSCMHGIGKEIRFSGITDEYASMLVKKTMEQRGLSGEPSLEIIETAIKQALCFEALKLAQNNGSRELSLEKAKGLDITAELLSERLHHEDTHLLNSKELLLEANNALKVMDATVTPTDQADLEKLTGFNQKEVARIEATMAYKNASKSQELQPEHVKPRCSEIEI
jgi:thymidine kinase